MKTLLITIAIFLSSLTIQAQYKVDGDKLVKIENTEKNKEPVKTKYTLEIKGKVYPVYQGSKGGYFILRTSAKTGKQYKQYIKIETK